MKIVVSRLVEAVKESMPVLGNTGGIAANESFPPVLLSPTSRA